MYNPFAAPLRQGNPRTVKVAPPTPPASHYVDATSREPVMAGYKSFARKARSGSLYRNDEQTFGHNGEVNASNKEDLMKRFAQIIQDLHEGRVTPKRFGEDESAAARQDREVLVAEALENPVPTNEAFKILGEVISDTLWEALGREGLARNILALNPTPMGQVGRVKMRKKDVVAWFVTADHNVAPSVVRQFWIYPPEYYLVAFILLENREIAQSGTDIMN